MHITSCTRQLSQGEQRSDRKLCCKHVAVSSVLLRLETEFCLTREGFSFNADQFFEWVALIMLQSSNPVVCVAQIVQILGQDTSSSECEWMFSGPSVCLLQGSCGYTCRSSYMCSHMVMWMNDGFSVTHLSASKVLYKSNPLLLVV